MTNRENHPVTAFTLTSIGVKFFAHSPVFPCFCKQFYLLVPLLQVNSLPLCLCLCRFLEIIITSGTMPWRRGHCQDTRECTSDWRKKHRWDRCQFYHSSLRHSLLARKSRKTDWITQWTCVNQQRKGSQHRWQLVKHFFVVFS